MIYITQSIRNVIFFSKTIVGKWNVSVPALPSSGMFAPLFSLPLSEYRTPLPYRGGGWGGGCGSGVRGGGGGGSTCSSKRKKRIRQVKVTMYMDMYMHMSRFFGYVY